jgi:hypothetical protein
MCCIKQLYQRCALHFLLQDIDRYVPAEDIRTWNILDATQGASMAWKSIILITSDHQTSLDSPGPSSVHVIGEEEEKTGKTAASCTILSHRSSNGVVIADLVIISSDTGDRIVKAIDELQ